jgi:hypothetical protein
VEQSAYQHLCTGAGLKLGPAELVSSSRVAREEDTIVAGLGVSLVLELMCWYAFSFLGACGVVQRFTGVLMLGLGGVSEPSTYQYMCPGAGLKPGPAELVSSFRMALATRGKIPSVLALASALSLGIDTGMLLAPQELPVNQFTVFYTSGVACDACAGFYRSLAWTLRCCGAIIIPIHVPRSRAEAWASRTGTLLPRGLGHTGGRYQVC